MKRRSLLKYFSGSVGGAFIGVAQNKIEDSRTTPPLKPEAALERLEDNVKKGIYAGVGAVIIADAITSDPK